MSFFPDMQTVISFGNLRVTWYAVIILTGAFIAYNLSLRQFKKWGYEEDVFLNFFIMMLPISIIGARLYYVIFEWSNQYAADPIRIFYVWEGGLAIHGGLIAGAIFGYFYFKKHCINGLRVADVIFPNVMLAQAIGRWGNFVNKEAFGGPVADAFYQGWPSFIKNNMYINGQYHHPTFLYESVGNIIGFLLITFVYKKYGRKKRGDLAWAYITWYGMVRFFVEGLRTDSLMIGPLRVAQVISILGVLLGVAGILGVWDRLFQNMWPFRKEKPVVIFDLDGTLIDSKELIQQSFLHTFAHYKPDYQVSEEELHSFLGPTLVDSFSRYFDACMVEEVVEYYRKFNHEQHDVYLKEIPHVKETLATLQAEGYDMAIVSNKLTPVVEMGLKSAGIQEYFSIIVGAGDVAHAKPSPEGILKACAMLPRSHDDVVYVGDTPSDIQTCKNMGAFSVAFVSESERANEMKAMNPCAMITDMMELTTLLKEDHEWSDATI